MSRDLPAHVKRDLDRAAAGIGRTPTTAHPDCICGKPLPDAPTRYGRTPVGKRENCPQHGPERES